MLTLNPTLVETIPSEPYSLLSQAQAGDAEAFGELCRAYETPLLRQALALCGQPALAEDRPRTHWLKPGSASTATTGDASSSPGSVPSC